MADSWKAAAEARKPNSVRLRTALAPALRRDDHSSSPVITDGIQQPTRRRRTGRPLIRLHPAYTGRRPMTPPYLALLRAGFCLPPVLPRARCALTAPFHPYPPSPSALRAGLRRGRLPHVRELASPKLEARRAESEGGRYVFCATVLRVAPTGRYPAHCPAEFGLSSLPRRPATLRTTADHVRPAIVWASTAVHSLALGRLGSRASLASRDEHSL